MNVLLVIKHKKEIPLIIPWALTFARAEKAQLKILCVHQGLKKGEPRQIPIKGDDHGTTNSLLLSTIKFLPELNEADVVLVEPDENFFGFDSFRYMLDTEIIGSNTRCGRFRQSPGHGEVLS